MTADTWARIIRCSKYRPNTMPYLVKRMLLGDIVAFMNAFFPLPPPDDLVRWSMGYNQTLYFPVAAPNPTLFPIRRPRYTVEDFLRSVEQKFPMLGPLFAAVTELYISRDRYMPTEHLPPDMKCFHLSGSATRTCSSIAALRIRCNRALIDGIRDCVSNRAKNV